MVHFKHFYCSGHVECLKWLLANRANPSLRDVDGRTPYDIAVEYQQDECIELLELMSKYKDFPKYISFAFQWLVLVEIKS